MAEAADLRAPGWSVMRLPGDPLPKTEARPPIDFDDRSDKLFYVMGRVPDMMDSDDVAKALRAALTPAALAGAVAVLAIWAASHFFAVGFAVDVVLLAVGFALIGWGIFRALDAILDALKVVEEATSYGELDRAADLMGDAIIQLGVDSFLALVTRGAARLTKTGGAAADALKAARPKPKPAAKPANPAKPKPKKDNDAPAVAARPPRDVPCFKLPKGCNRKEFQRQLDEQMAAINKMTADDMGYAQAVLDQARAQWARQGGKGSFTKLLRQPEAQTKTRGAYRAALARTGLDKNAVDAKMGELDATHFLDIIAGGDPSKVGMGGSKENQRIGPMWAQKGRVSTLKDEVDVMNRAGRSSQKLNVKLSIC